MNTIKCCNKEPNIRYLYANKIITVIQCNHCKKQRDIVIPHHIPQEQYKQYYTKKYNEIIKKEGIMLNHLIKQLLKDEK